MQILIFRTLLIYLCVLAAIRLMGKRQLGELQPEELVSTILISNLASISIEEAETPLASSLTPLFLIACLELIISVLGYHSRRFSCLVSGRPKTVIRGGKIDQAALRELRLSAVELLEALRAKDVFDPRQVEHAVLETNGTLSVAKKPGQEAATLAGLGIPPQQKTATLPFVLEGRILPENLVWCGKDKAWLDKTLRCQGVALQDVLVMLGNDTEDHLLVPRQPPTARKAQ